MIRFESCWEVHCVARQERGQQNSVPRVLASRRHLVLSQFWLVSMSSSSWASSGNFDVCSFQQHHVLHWRVCSLTSWCHACLSCHMNQIQVCHVCRIKNRFGSWPKLVAENVSQAFKLSSEVQHCCVGQQGRGWQNSVPRVLALRRHLVNSESNLPC